MSGMTWDWERVMAWLGANAPQTLAGMLRPQPGAADAVSAQLGFDLADDLRTWLGLTGGSEQPSQLLPRQSLLSPSEIVDTWQLWLEIADDPALPADMVEGTRANPAGDMAYAWLPEFVPIATDRAGNNYFIDLRPGPRRGCVSDWSKDEGSLYEPYWESLELCLSDLADSLESGAPCGRPYWRHRVADGLLEWYVQRDT